MPALPPIDFATLTDTHVQPSATSAEPPAGWHNRYVAHDPLAPLQATITSVNSHHPGFVAITGDITQAGDDAEIAAARAAFDQIDAPLILCKGNHDQRTEQKRAAFEEVFGTQAPVGLLTPDDLPALPDGAAMLVVDAWWVGLAGRLQPGRPDHVPVPVQMAIPEEQVEAALSALNRSRPDLLLVFSHFPLLSQAGYTASQGGKDAGYLLNGEMLLREVSRRTGAVLCFAGHQHFHHIVSGERWLHCTTASIVEYPAEYRTVSVGDGGVTIRTWSGLDAATVEPALTENPWVRGRSGDRECTWKP